MGENLSERKLLASLTLTVVAVGLVLLFGSPAQAQANHVSESFPADRQLYPRNLDTNKATVAVAGRASSSSVNSMRLRVTKDDVRLAALEVDVDPADRTYKHTVELNAELASYDLDLFEVLAGKETLVKSADDVLAGDSYLLNGQSNIIAIQRCDTCGSTAELESTFIRTFGDNPEHAPPRRGAPADYLKMANDTVWRQATGDSRNEASSIGQLGMTLASDLVTRHKVPVAIINTGSAGSPVSYFQQNLKAPDDLATNYGRQRKRLTDSGLANDILGMVWYQGEADLTNTSYAADFKTLEADYRKDFLSTKPLYVIQIDNWFSASDDDLLILRDNFRKIDDSGNTQLISLNNVSFSPVPDTAHYPLSGYTTIASRISESISQDIHGYNFGLKVRSADVQDVSCSTSICDSLRVAFNSDAELTVSQAQATYFQLEDCDTTVDSISSADKRTITLTTSSNRVDQVCSGLSYPGPRLGGTPAVKNISGAGILTFFDQPIDSKVFAAAPRSCNVTVEGNKATVTWPAANNSDGYRIYRSVNNSDQYWRGRVDDTTSFADSLRTGASHRYLVASVNPDRTSTPRRRCTPDVGATTLNSAKPPRSCNVTVEGNKATVTWPAANNSDGYRIYRSVNNSDQYWRGRVDDTTSFADSLRTGASHRYLVASVNPDRTSTPRRRCTPNPLRG